VPSAPPRETAIGALGYYVPHADPTTYQPTNITWGIIPPLEAVPRDRSVRKHMMAERALAALDAWQRARDTVRMTLSRAPLQT
jgi:methylenetetrahydrofolate--tRNA-(uracil-5-)-methyltransferase